MGITWRTDLDNMVFIIRNEGTLALKALCSVYGEEKVAMAQVDFLQGLKNLMQQTFQNARVVVIDAKEQIKHTQEALKNVDTISLDTFYKGTHNIGVTRLFKVVNGKTEFIRMTSRDKEISINEQIKAIKSGKYTLVDDDAVGGRTIREIKRLLPSDVIINNTYLMMDIYRNSEVEAILDVVDCRDFIFGVAGCGLTTLVEGIGVTRLPYMYPFIDIDDKANIPLENAKDFSLQIWEINRKFWEQIDKRIPAMECGNSSIYDILMHYGIGEPGFRAFDISMQDAINRFSKLTNKGVIA